MTDTDVAIIGGGLAGSIAAAMLGRAGVRAALIDPHAVYPPDLRCEKLDEPRTLRMTLVFSGKELNALPGFGPGSESMAAHNAFLREHFPTRVDALFTRPAIDLGAYRNVAILDDVQVELELGALPAGPITAPRRLTSSDSSRKAAPRRAASRRCAPATSR